MSATGKMISPMEISKNNEFMVIECERLYLRELKPSDKDELKKVLSDPESMKYYPKPFSDEEVENWIAKNIRRYTTNKHGLWAVVLRASDVFIGDCGITMQNIDGEIVPEIGFHIIKEYCNQGYATEAAIACRDYAFEVLNYSEIFSYTTVQNAASQKVAEKVGMSPYKYYDKDGVKHIVQSVKRQ